MPINLDEIEKYGAPISFESPGSVTVRVGPCDGKALKKKKIPLDGRLYICAGKIILKNGLPLQANFEIKTHSFDFLERDTVRVYIDSKRSWYTLDEDELWELLELTKEDGLPYKWIPDIPLDYYLPGPYPMNWPED